MGCHAQDVSVSSLLSSPSSDLALVSVTQVLAVQTSRHTSSRLDGWCGSRAWESTRCGIRMKGVLCILRRLSGSRHVVVRMGSAVTSNIVLPTIAVAYNLSATLTWKKSESRKVG